MKHSLAYEFNAIIAEWFGFFFPHQAQLGILSTVKMPGKTQVVVLLVKNRTFL